MLMSALGVSFLPLPQKSSQSLALCSELEHRKQNCLTLSELSHMRLQLLRDGDSSRAACIISLDQKVMYTHSLIELLTNLRTFMAAAFKLENRYI